MYSHVCYHGVMKSRIVQCNGERLQVTPTCQGRPPVGSEQHMPPSSPSGTCTSRSVPPSLVSFPNSHHKRVGEPNYTITTSTIILIEITIPSLVHHLTVQSPWQIYKRQSLHYWYQGLLKKVSRKTFTDKDCFLRKAPGLPLPSTPQFWPKALQTRHTWDF